MQSTEFLPPTERVLEPLQPSEKWQKKPEAGPSMQEEQLDKGNALLYNVTCLLSGDDEKEIFYSFPFDVCEEI